jgi:hypothetical protein
MVRRVNFVVLCIEVAAKEKDRVGGGMRAWKRRGGKVCKRLRVRGISGGRIFSKICDWKWGGSEKGL